MTMTEEPEAEAEVQHVRDDLYRAMPGGVSEDGKTLTVRLAPHDQWAEIESVAEGHFMERFSRSAYKKTMAERPPKILFQHGKGSIGESPIATTDEVGEDATSPFVRGRLLDGVPELIVDGIRKGVYGASHRFSVVREDPPQWWTKDAPVSAHNPKGLPERTITEARLHELGPVTWPAYAGASVALRSLTDEMRSPVTFTTTEPVAPSVDAEPEEAHLEPERRDEPDPPPDAAVIAAQDPPEGGSSDSRSEHVAIDTSKYVTIEDKTARVVELNAEIKRAADVPGILSESEQTLFDDRVTERGQLEAEITAQRTRQLQVRVNSEDPERVVQTYSPPAVIKGRDLESIYDVRRIEREARSEEQRVSNLHDAAMRAVEGAHFPTTERAKGQGEIESLLNGGKPGDTIDPVEMDKRVLYTGAPAYRRAYRKFLTQGPAGAAFTAEESHAFEEARTALVTASNTAVPFDLDPTMIINTSGAINPFRAAFRVVKTTSNDWRPSVSSGMTAVYEDEATAATDLSPAFTAPARLLVKAHTAATFSVEIEGDYALGSLEAELTKEIADAKDVLEATEFSTAIGTGHHPMGIYTYYTLNFLDTTTTLTIVPADLYKLAANLGPRYRGNAVWLGSPYFYSLVRGIDTAGGAGLWVDNLTLGGSLGDYANNGRLGNLVGYPAYEAIAPANTSMASTEKVAILADRTRFVIIDRVGLNIELIPNFLSAATGLPTGQRMVYAWWRNTSVGLGLNTLGAGREACIFRGK
jgi:HK97 family phage major capsid protein